MHRNAPAFVLACVLALFTMSEPLSAQPNQQFSSSSHFVVNPDLNSGTAFGSANGSSAIVTTLQSGTYFEIDPPAGVAYVYANAYVSGVWGNASTVSPYYNFLENQGLRTYSSIALTTVLWNGTYYEFNDDVRVSLNGYAGLSRDPQLTWLIGYSSVNVNGIGAIPIDSTSAYHIYEPGHPTWLPDWEVSYTSRWLVTASFGSLPTPGSFSLMALGSLVALRRRR